MSRMSSYQKRIAKILSFFLIGFSFLNPVATVLADQEPSTQKEYYNPIIVEFKKAKQVSDNEVYLQYILSLPVSATSSIEFLVDAISYNSSSTSGNQVNYIDFEIPEDLTSSSSLNRENDENVNNLSKFLTDYNTKKEEAFGESSSITIEDLESPSSISNCDQCEQSVKPVVGVGYAFAHARYLDTKIHSFLSVDPAIYDLSNQSSKLNRRYLQNPQEQNTYAYALNNPIVFIDPDGKAAEFNLYTGTFYDSETGQPVTQLFILPVMAVGSVAAAANTFYQTASRVSVDYAYGFGTRVTSNLTKLSTLPIVNSASTKLNDVSTRIGQTPQKILETASKTGQAVVDYANKGNVNIYIPQTAEKVTRITTNPQITKIISNGTAEVSQVANGLSSGRFIPISNTNQNLIKVLGNIFDSLFKK